MRIIALKTLKLYIEKYPLSAGALKSWNEEVSEADWKSPNELKSQFKNASLIGKKRVIFNIHGNMFRLIMDVEYKFKLVFVVWFGTHKEYDKIDAHAIEFDKTD